MYTHAHNFAGAYVFKIISSKAINLHTSNISIKIYTQETIEITKQTHDKIKKIISYIIYHTLYSKINNIYHYFFIIINTFLI